MPGYKEKVIEQVPVDVGVHEKVRTFPDTDMFVHGAPLLPWKVTVGLYPNRYPANVTVMVVMDPTNTVVGETDTTTLFVSKVSPDGWNIPREPCDVNDKYVPTVPM